MSTTLIVVLVVVALIVVLAAGGAIAQRRRMTRNTCTFREQLEHVNADLAQARAQDRGWDREAMESAAREAYARERPGTGEPELTLVRVIDRPGTEEDKALFRAGRGELLTLGRREGAWVLEAIE